MTYITYNDDPASRTRVAALVHRRTVGGTAEQATCNIKRTADRDEQMEWEGQRIMTKFRAPHWSPLLSGHCSDEVASGGGHLKDPDGLSRPQATYFSVSNGVAARIDSTVPWRGSPGTMHNVMSVL